MRNSIDNEFDGIKNVKGRRSIRNEEDDGTYTSRSISEPPRSYSAYINNLPSTSSRLKPIAEKNNDDDCNGSSEDDESKSNSQLNESDLDLEMPDSGSASVSQTPTPTPLGATNTRRINSETNLNESQRRLSGFMGNRSKRFCASTSELSFTSHLDTHKSLFSPKNNQNALSRQSFNSSLYGSNMSLSSTNSRLFMTNSPFYNGKTMFGGASAYPRRDINQHKILRTPIQMRPSSSLSNSSNTSVKSDMTPLSNTAKRILEVMNQFSGPLKEARSMGSNINSILKVPSLVQNHPRFGDDELNLNRSIALSRPSVPYGRPLSSSSKSAMRSDSPLLNSSIVNKPLQIPTMSQLLQMKRLQNNTERVREIANRSDSFLNNNLEYKLPASDDRNNTAATVTSTSGSSSLKMKSNITKNLLRNDKNAVNDQLPATPLNLPNVQLPQLKSIPKFDIQLSATTVSTCGTLTYSAPSTKAASNNVTKTPAVQFNYQPLSNSCPSAKATELKQHSKFVFSEPTRLHAGDVNLKNLYQINEKFSFSKPLPIDRETTIDAAPAKSPFKSSLSTPATDNLFKSLAAKQKAQWECDSCLTRNDSDKAKCLCCENDRPGSGNSTDAPILKAVSTPVAQDDLFKNLAAQQKKAQWECDSCMTKNDANKDKCACCETPKSGSKPANSAPLASSTTFTFGMPPAKITPASDDLFKNLVAQQKKSQWECDSCMTGNDANKDKCACCEAPKPGSKPSAPATSTFSFGAQASSQPSFGMPAITSSDPGFKKLVDKQVANWECSACLTRNEPSKTKCVCCEQAKPGSSQESQKFTFGSKLTSTVSLPAPTEVKFSFGIPAIAAKSEAPKLAKKEETVKETVQDEVDKPKPTFSFGIQSSVPAPSVVTVDTKVSEPVTVTSSTFSFKAPEKTSSIASTSFTFKSSSKDEEKKEEPKPVEPTPVVEKPPPMFSFGSKVEKPSELPKMSFGSLTKPAETEMKPSEPSKREVAPAKSTFGGFSFGAAPAVTNSTPAFGSSLNSNGGFSFGAFAAKSTEPQPAAEPVVSLSSTLPAAGGFSFGTKNASSNSMTFGNSSPMSVNSTPVTTQNAGLFSFKPETTPAANSLQASSNIFGLNTTSPSFGNPTSVFGQTSAPGGFNTFGAKQEQTTSAQQASIFSFGGQSKEPAKAPIGTMVFGQTLANPSQSATPMFGATQTATPTFGATQTATPTFGATQTATPTFGAPVNNNNESGFGSKMPATFGSANQPQKRAFEFGSNADAPQTKKVEFGSSHHQPQSTTAAPFQFNPQPESKPAFNFTSTAPSFNFSNNASAPNNSLVQPNLYQFGNASTSNASLFAFGTNPQPAAPSSTFQFGAAAPAINIPGITSFSATGTGSAAAARKKIRATRRLPQTR